MRFDVPLIEGRLLRRYKRFLADVDIAGETVTVHCANPGAMIGLTEPDNRVWLSRSSNAKRKLPLSWEMVEAVFGPQKHIVGINTAHPNRIAAEAIAAGAIPELAGYSGLRREVRYGKASRVDILLEAQDRPACYVEVKNVHLMREPGLAEFPDAVTARGARHLAELGDMVEAGHRAVMLFVIQMPADRFTLAADIDPFYAQAFARATARGVEALAVSCRLDPGGGDIPAIIELDKAVPVPG
ncbi:MAG: DNA/RNA nuclease SfsA [Pseudochelatococcus sp.]|jgi:sugar fermentation stimulation protein A|uniref:DNA/RNA nuclease SfsA n=1 Tax=Pseudochelatococcus sp. TaxID=2020869 RepID=UPI003D9412D5